MLINSMIIPTGGSVVTAAGALLNFVSIYYCANCTMHRVSSPFEGKAFSPTTPYPLKAFPSKGELFGVEVT